MSALLAVEGLAKSFPVAAGWGVKAASLQAVDDVWLDLDAGETLGIVGESGCGKTTLARLVLRLLAPSAGRIVFDGVDVTRADERALAAMRRTMQVVFQDPFGSLDPRGRVGAIVAEPLINLGWDRARIRARVGEVLDLVGLPAEYASRYPHAFSGGQRQRIGIARALAPDPRLVVCDEAVSALDVSIQAQVLNLLGDIQARLGVAYLFISHNLAVVRQVSHRVAVMYLGRVVELSPEAALFDRPLHPYTALLIAAVPEPDPTLGFRGAPIQGELPSPLDPPPGCPFHPRCPIADSRCRVEPPAFREAAPGRFVRCHRPGELTPKGTA